MKYASPLVFGKILVLFDETKLIFHFYQLWASNVAIYPMQEKK